MAILSPLVAVYVKKFVNCYMELLHFADFFPVFSFPLSGFCFPFTTFSFIDFCLNILRLC